MFDFRLVEFHVRRTRVEPVIVYHTDRCGLGVALLSTQFQTSKSIVREQVVSAEAKLGKIAHRI